MYTTFRSLPILLAAASSFQLARATIFCENNPSYSFTFNNRSRDCDWLLSADQATRSNICSTDLVVKQACPFSCSVCCKDNPFYRLYVNNANLYSCGDIGSNANLQALYCDLSRGPNGAKVKKTCPEACGYCPAPLGVVSLTTTSSPTSLPTNAPTMQPSKSPISIIAESPVALPVDEESDHDDYDEKQNDDLIINKASISENDTTKIKKNRRKITYIVVGSVSSFFVLLGLVLLRRKGFYSEGKDDSNDEMEVVDDENNDDAKEASFFEMIINPFDWGSIFRHNSDSEGESETETYI